MVFQIVDCMACSFYRAHAVLIPRFVASRTCFHPPSRAGRYSTGISYKEAKDTLDKKWGFVTKYSRVNDIYFALGFYYSVQLKDRKTGYEYFSKLHKDSPFFKLAEKIKQDLNKVK